MHDLVPSPTAVVRTTDGSKEKAPRTRLPPVHWNSYSRAMYASGIRSAADYAARDGSPNRPRSTRKSSALSECPVIRAVTRPRTGRPRR